MKRGALVVRAVEENKLQKLHVRKLEKEEHIRTRKLWEEIFAEDSKEFLDYYYSVKVRDNEIYVIEDGEDIVSMLHLNPYHMRVGKQIYGTHYIVAVATDERYRRKGLMAKLLNYAMDIMKGRNEPFTFLMPASEAIYKPFGFEFVYEQEFGDFFGSNKADIDTEFRLADRDDCKMIADFANEFLKGKDVVAWRDAHYYETLLLEHQSENGGILLAKEDDKITGVFCFYGGEKKEIREPLFYEEGILLAAIHHLTRTETECVRCAGYGKQTKPMIMAKILCPEILDDLKGKKVFLNEVV